MTDEEINKRIYELAGMCWHELQSEPTALMAGRKYRKCKKCKCNIDIDNISIDFTASWKGFGILWEWWQKQKEFNDFIFELDGDNPPALAEATVEFFKEEKYETKKEHQKIIFQCKLMIARLAYLYSEIIKLNKLLKCHFELTDEIPETIDSIERCIFNEEVKLDVDHSPVEKHVEEIK